MKSAWLLVGLVGCTTHHGSSGGSGALSGSRLRVRWEQAGGGRRFVGWHDDQLDLDCDFDSYIYNRAHRCLPAVAVVDNDYLDSACTQQVATTTEPYSIAGYAHYAISKAANTCDAPPQLFAAAQPTMMATYFLVDGVCKPEVARLAYVPGAAVSETAFVSAVESHDVNGQNWLLAEDGALVPWGGWDGKYAVKPTSSTWQPWIVAYNGEGFSDSTCTTSTAAKLPDSARCPLESALIYDFANADAYSYAELGAPLAMTYTTDNGVCAEHESDPRLTFEVGVAISPSSLLPASTQLAGAGPVAVRYAVMNGHTIYNTGFGTNGSPSTDPFVDTASGLDCVSEPMTDNARHCVPQPGDPSDVLYFADAACTQLVMPSTTSSPPSLFSYFDAGFVSVRPVIGAQLTALLYDSNGACTPATSQPYYALGDELPASRFAVITTTTD
jgi:hypothetical protein